MKHESKLSRAVQAMKPSGIRKFFDLASTMEDVISLGVGEPDFDTPWHIREAAIYAIENGQTHYTSNQGLLPLREAICDYQKQRFHLQYNADNVLISVGGSEAIDITLRAFINPHDEVIVLNPSYVAYEPCIQLAQGIPVCVDLLQENDFKLTYAQLQQAITNKTKAIILNFPNNPTGGVMNHEDYQKIVPLLKQHELIIISDEIYAELTYEDHFCSPANFPEIKDQVIIISGFSKAYAMTGWRVGYILANQTYIGAINKIHQYIIMSAPTPSQYAAIEATLYGQAEVDKMHVEYKQRRNFLVQNLNRMGLKTHLPKGAFYVFPNIAYTNLSSVEFCERLLQEQKVACVPGSAFGEGGEGFIRISYAYSIDHIKEALKRIELFLKQF